MTNPLSKEKVISKLGSHPRPETWPRKSKIENVTRKFGAK